MIKFETYQKAIKRYPFGSFVECLSNGKEYLITSFDHPYKDMNDQDNEVWFISDDEFGVCVYKKRKWANILNKKQN
jgi:hypothetical protein